MSWFKSGDPDLPVSVENVTRLDGRVPLQNAIPLGLQHVLAMFLANVAPMLIVASAAGLDSAETARLIQTTLLVAGVASIVQLYPVWRVGSGLPVIMGISFTFVPILSFIAQEYDYATVIGAILVGGIIEGTLGLFARYWKKLISPIVSSCVVTAIGFSLFEVGANYFGGGQGAPDFGSAQNWIVGSITLIVAMLFQVFGKGFIKQISILMGLVVGYIVSLFFGMVDLSVFSDPTSYAISLPQIMPFIPKFNISAIISVTLIFLVSLTETFGDTTAVAESGLHRDLTTRELGGSICADGYCSAISSFFGCMPVTSFSQNVGLVAMTGIVNRFTLLMGALILVLASFFNIISTFFNTLPNCVLGGCTLLMFGQILITGIEMISKCGFTKRNSLIAALSLIIGMGFTLTPDLFAIFPEIIQNIFAQNVVAIVFVISIVLNLVLPENIEDTFNDDLFKEEREQEEGLGGVIISDEEKELKQD